MGSFELNGQDISVRYTAHNKTLVVRGKNLVGHEEQTFSDVKLSESGIGVTITVVLLDSSRNGTKSLLHLLRPGTARAAKELAMTGVAIVVSDFSHLVGGAPPVHHSYATKSLTGTMHG